MRAAPLLRQAFADLPRAGISNRKFVGVVAPPTI
jgi:hypothetical protein